jgi:uncharacterized membrane protein
MIKVNFKRTASALILGTILTTIAVFSDLPNIITQSPYNTVNAQEIEDSKIGGLKGTVVGLQEEDIDKALIILYDDVNSFTTSVNSSFNFTFNDVPEGDYYLKIEVEGYYIPQPEACTISGNQTIEKDININYNSDSNFFYHWAADDTYYGYEESAQAPSQKVVEFLD